MKVRVGQEYIFYANLLDRMDAKCVIASGEIVRVGNLPSAPPANTMGQCYVFDIRDGKFIGMVSTGSLYAKKDAQLVADAMKRDLARREARA
jgi:hypothetical protein